MKCARNQGSIQRFWKRLSKQQNTFNCFYCSRQVFREAPEIAINKATVDHIIPLCLGGTNEIDNLVSSCRECNQIKAMKENSDALKLRSLGIIFN